MSFDEIRSHTSWSVFSFLFYLDPRLAHRLCLSACIVIVERRADDILGVKDGVAAFVIQFLECYYNIVATCCCIPLSSGRLNTSGTRQR